MMFRKFHIDSEIRKREKEWSEFDGNEFSIRKDGDNRTAGNFAEMVFQKLYPHALRISDVDKNADFVLRKKRIDVKTKVRTVPAALDFEASVEARQRFYDCDFYCFFSYDRIASVLEYCGWISKNEFFSKARLISRGDSEGSNNWIASVDCYQLPYSSLNR